MKLIGYWMTDQHDTRLPLPQELVGELSAAIRDRVCGYLTAGELFEQYRGLSWCRFRCGAADREMGFREFTDGEWVWPEGLVHYVRHHGIVLPEEFLASATSDRSVAKAEEGDVSLDFWLNWTASWRPAVIREHRATAPADARAVAPALIEQIVDEIRKRELKSD